MTNTHYVGSTEYLTATVTADVDLDDQPVALSLDHGTTWLPCTWEGDDPATSRAVRTADPVTFTTAHIGSWTVYLKITDTPEVPIIVAGTIRVRLRT